MKKVKIRLYTDIVVNEGFAPTLGEAQSHYLCNVMKVQTGDEILCFNNRDGEFLCRIEKSDKKHTLLKIIKQTRKFEPSPDIWLLFAPLKKDQTDFVIQKATELGARKIIPVFTKFTITDKVKTDRFKAQAIEAAEQSRRVDVPEIGECVSLEKILLNWNPERKLFFMDETGGGESVLNVFGKAKGSKAAILVGPEGGFDADELQALRKAPFAQGVSLGKRILRAETAVAAALACWQAAAGDWTEEVEENGVTNI